MPPTPSSAPSSASSSPSISSPPRSATRFVLSPGREPGSPDRRRPEGMADVGGHIEITAEHVGPNVARSLKSPVPITTAASLVLSMYAGNDFLEMVWDDRVLSRPQVELLAARTSALNECFY